MSDLRDIAVKYAHLLSASDYSKLLNLADEIERLRDKLLHSDRKEIEACYRKMDEQQAEIERLTVRNKNQCERLDQQIKHNADLINRNAKLQAVVDAARDFVNNHMDHDDAMRIFDALAALDTVDQQDTADGS